MAVSTESQLADKRAYYAAHREERRAYQRAWDEKNRDRSRARLLRLKERNYAEICALKLQRGCMDCGYAENADALQFDHRPGELKLHDVTSSLAAMGRMRREIAKCDVVCSNCHSIRTAQRRRKVAQR